MFRNALAAALRHLFRSRLYTAISVLGLAVGLSVALLVALVIRNQYSYDHDVPGYARTYAANGQWMAALAQPMKLRFPLVVESVARVIEQPLQLQHDGRIAREVVSWVDADFASVLPQPAYAGDAAAALRVPDGLVLSRSYARRFFGRDAPLGETLTLDGHDMVVRAVVEDPRPNATHAVRHILAAAVASFSPMLEAEKYEGMITQMDVESGTKFSVPVSLSLYVRLKPGIELRVLQQQMKRVPPPISRMYGTFTASGSPVPGSLAWPELRRIDRLNTDEKLHPGFRDRMIILAMLGAAVLLIATVNFANLQTALAPRRAREVAIRRLAGAGRRVLIVQFLGEAVIHALAATLLAVALAEWLLPYLNAYLDTGAALDYALEPRLIAALVGATLLFSLIAGAWPAFVLSGFPPGVTLRGGAVLVAGGALVRQMLVTMQFALLIGLVICAGVVNSQHDFALHEALRVDHDQVLLVRAPVRSALLRDEVRKLPGVRNVTRSSGALLGKSGFSGSTGAVRFEYRNAAGQYSTVDGVEVDFDLFDFYGVRPLAGTLPAAVGAYRVVPRDSRDLVLNASAVRRFGLGSAAEAVGKELLRPPFPPGLGIPTPPADRVVAVVPDFSMGSVSEAVTPMLYFQPTYQTGLRQADVLSVRLKGQQIPETLQAIDQLWAELGNTEVSSPSRSGPSRMFLDEHFQRSYLAMLRQFQAFGLCALIAMALSGIGLFALTAATAERRTKEIGIRKALGADTGDVLKLLLWQFAKPVVWANLLAWPVAGYLMQRWLNGFAYRIDLPFWLFPATGLMAVLIALATVGAHALRVARAKPVTALRYE